MPSDLTSIAAQYRLFDEVLLAALLLAPILLPRRRVAWIRWAVAVGVMLVLTYVLNAVGGIYNDPHPLMSGL